MAVSTISGPFVPRRRDTCALWSWHAYPYLLKTLISDHVTRSKAKGLSLRLDHRPVREILHGIQDDTATGGRRPSAGSGCN